jgi:hypothetical protein
MNDAQRYRMNAAECLSAAERCDPHYRGQSILCCRELARARPSGGDESRSTRELGHCL